MQQIIDEINAINASTKAWNLGNDFASKHEKTFLKTLNTFTEQEQAHVDDLLVATIECGHTGVMEAVGDRILEKRKLIDWKNRPDIVNRIIDTVIKCGTTEDPAEKKHYTRFMTKVMETLAANQILEKHCNKVFELTRTAFKTLQDPDMAIHNAALPCITKYPWKDKPENIPEMMKLMLNAVKHNPDVREGAWLCTNVGIALPMMFVHPAGKKYQMQVLPDVTEMFNICLNCDWKYSEDPSKENMAYKLLQSIMENFLSNGHTDPQLIKPMMSGIKELWECSDPTLQRDANYIMTAMAGNAELTGDSTDVLIEKYLKSRDSTIAGKLKDMYIEQPEKMHPYLPRLVEVLEEENDPMLIMLIQMFTEVAKREPMKITPAAIKAIVSKLSHPQQCFMAMMCLEAIALKQPAAILPYEPQIIKAYQSLETMASQAGNILIQLADNESRQRKYMTLFAERVNSISGVYQIVIVMQMRQLGTKCPKILAEQRTLIERLRATPALTDMCQATLDVIDGRTLEKVSHDVIGQRKDINQLDTRVTSTEDNVNNLGVEVNANQRDIAKVKVDVNDQGQRLDQLKTVVDDTVARVDELERKTLSHAPAWSRDVAKLLNPPADSDWRLLASRLGYTADDVRAWATQPDPCLSLLDEWFATHSTREATHAVLKTLTEINRTDAAAVVQGALKSVEHVLRDDPSEPPSPPPIFLSYQWAHQPEVKLLRRHLGTAGYASWMDVGQMGGGDKLFAKIDAGIRAAKAVVCCVTAKYAESPNCNREVNLAVALGKPIIPLLVEKMNWPPPGAMGPIFGEYIFVRFFQRDGEQTRDDRYWPQDKFSELLMQLRYYIAPEVDAIPEDSLYKNWWKPPPEVIVIKPRTSAASGLTPVEVPNTISNQSKMPEVFISYQWDKQVQIKALVQRLSGVGYNCWLDILQMGGGDSLFDKIDQGLRGCKIVVSCVTTKYAKSANCRREVSLADALKKPIVPLLLEQITWPPEGPMGPILTQLLYINFAQPNEAIQNNWDCPQFDELVRKLAEHVPLSTTTNAQGKSESEKPRIAVQENPSKLPDKSISVGLKSGLAVDGGKRTLEHQENTASVQTKTTFCTIF